MTSPLPCGAIPAKAGIHPKPVPPRNDAFGFTLVRL